MSKAAIVYYSKTGNTKKLALAIGQATNADVHTTEDSSNEYVDVLFIGASVYKFGVDKSIVEYIKNLDASKVGSVAIFSTSCHLQMAYPKISELLKVKGIKVFEDNFHCAGQFFMLNKNRPNEVDIENVKNFAKKILESIS